MEVCLVTACSDAGTVGLFPKGNSARPALENLNDYVDQTAVLLEESQQLNFMRWPILNKYVHQNPQISGSYEGEVRVVKDYITRRLTRFDQLVRR